MGGQGGREDVLLCTGRDCFFAPTSKIEIYCERVTLGSAFLQMNSQPGTHR